MAMLRPCEVKFAGNSDNNKSSDEFELEINLDFSKWKSFSVRIFKDF